MAGGLRVDGGSGGAQYVARGLHLLIAGAKRMDGREWKRDAIGRLVTARVDERAEAFAHC